MRNEAKREHIGSRAGFTLVELMMVIAILAILVGLTVSGVNAARKSIQRRAIAMEVAALAQAVEAYKLKYGEYPPDGSNRAAFEAHFRSIFPNILPSEFGVLSPPVANSNYPLGVMDPAEAIVFCLGGFSNDPMRPFTGSGGPLVQGPSGWQYNLDRNQGFFDFDETRVNFSDEDPAGLGTQFQDGSPMTPDLLPVYSPRGRVAPFVYFVAPTYSFPIVGSNPPRNYYNHYKAANIPGVARPYKSDQINTAVNPNTLANRERYHRYMNEKSFQIVSAGLDDDYGGIWPLLHSDETPVFFAFPKGETVDIVTNARVGKGYLNPDGGPSAQLDNVTNFSEGTLESSLP
jgi:prepilin-type N-terminal cleavage/methylation domain-containing protein